MPTMEQLTGKPATEPETNTDPKAVPSAEKIAPTVDNVETANNTDKADAKAAEDDKGPELDATTEQLIANAEEAETSGDKGADEFLDIDAALEQDLPQSAIEDFEDPKVGPDGGAGDGSVRPVRPVDPVNTGLPALNDDGLRFMFVNSRGDITRMDSDTARQFYENPKLYAYTYDAGTKAGALASSLRWCDEAGNPFGGYVGEAYAKDEVTTDE